MKTRQRDYADSDRAALQAILRDHGFRSTEGRLRLISLLKGAHGPLSVPEIAARMNESLDEVNVYRALEALTHAGIFVRTDLRHGGAHYEFAHAHHHHLVCSRCGETEDVSDCIGKNVEQRVIGNSKNFASINTHSLEFFGTCRGCVGKV